jgi:hypothetical protein
MTDYQDLRDWMARPDVRAAVARGRLWEEK